VRHKRLGTVLDAFQHVDLNEYIVR